MIEVKGKCLIPALFPVLSNGHNCGHERQLTRHDVDVQSILQCLKQSLLFVSDLSRSIDAGLKSGRFNLNRPEDQDALLLDAAISETKRVIEQHDRVSQDGALRAFPDYEGEVIPVCREILMGTSNATKVANRGNRRIKPTRLDNLGKNLASANAVIYRREQREIEQRHLWDTDDRSKVMQALKNSELKASRLRNTAYLNSVEHEHLRGEYPFPVEFRELSSGDLWKRGDRHGAFCACIADIHATCARLWFEQHPSNDIRDRIKDLAGKFCVVVYNGESIHGCT